MSGEQLKGHLEALVLATLETGPAHGYAIIESLRQSSGGVFDLPEGTIYPALHRLEGVGSVTSSRETVDGRQRRVYRLSRAGRRSLGASRESWREFSSAVTRILNVSPA
jgi:PadR family transcriptional regulator, regulatory protein PadR